MPHVDVDGLTINYDVQGEGEPLLLIPYTSADHACWAFQLGAYTEHFSCIAIDLPGSGESDKPPGPYSTDGHADQVAAFLGAMGDIDAPTLITFGARDLVCSTHFADPLNSGIAGSELVVFDHLSHAGLHEDPETFNRVTLDFLLRQRS
jgi:pimeloyl-ACP methyl ester carboxylesterase